MFKFRSVKLIAFALIALFWIVACTPQSPTNTTTDVVKSTQPLRVTTIPWSGYSGHLVAVKQGFYEQAGIKVEDILLQSSSEQITAFLAGKVDLSWSTAGDAVQMTEKDPTLKIIFLCDYSNGADGIIGRNIKTPSDLKGKTVAREDVLFEKALLKAYLDKGGLTDKDITIKDLSAADSAAAFAAKRVDAAVTFEPFMTKAAKEGGGEIIFSTASTNLIADVLIARPDVIANRKEELLAYMKAVDKGIKLINANDKQAIEDAAGKLGIKPAELKEQLSGIILFDIEGNKTIGFNPDKPLSLIKALDSLGKAAYEYKVISKPLDVKTIYDDSIVKAL